jgi:two-component system alkaline phosphatase synthesis response regulator PhoP
MSNKVKVLIIDDDHDILELLRYNLEKEDYEVKTADNGRKGITIAKEFIPKLILLDIMMPGLDGVETCHLLREIHQLNNTFILFLTARSEEYSEVAAFDAGADDYLQKPIKPRALTSRITALLRRDSKNEKSNKITVGDLIIDKGSYTIHLKDKQVILPKKEFELLYFLAQHPNKVFSRDDLLYQVWGANVHVIARTVDVHVRKVREKIGDTYITTIKGVGYKFEVG